MLRCIILIMLLMVAGCSSADISDDSLASFDSSSVPQSNDRIIVRSASMLLVVDDPLVSLDDIRQLATEQGGWVVRSNVHNEQRARVTVQIRVPADRFDETLSLIKDNAIEVESETITGEDVTQEYVDLTSQLTNLEAAEAQLQTLMEDAEDTEAVLSVHNELVQIRGQIETTRGRINYFDEVSTFASIDVDLRMEDNNAFLADNEGWNPGDTVTDAFNVLDDVLRVIVDIVIFLVIVGIPVLIIGGIPIWMVYRAVDRLGRSASGIGEDTNIT